MESGIGCGSLTKNLDLERDGMWKCWREVCEVEEGMVAEE